MQKYSLTIFIQIVIVFITVLQLSAQENTRKKFSINDHEFVTTSAIESANIETSLLSKLSFGSTGPITSKGVIINGEEFLSYSGSLLFAGGKVAYKQKVNDWFGMYLDVFFLGRLGTQVPTLLAEGVNTATGSEIGWIFKLYQHQKGYLSGTLFTNRHMGSIIDFAGFVDDIIEGVPDSKLTNVVPVSVFGTRLQYAHAFSTIWGAQFDLSYAYGESLNRTSNKSNIDMGIFVDANLYAAKKIPLGFGLGYNLSSMPETIYNDDKMANVFYFNLAYTKSAEFELALEVMYYSIPLSNYTSTPSVISPSLLMKFMF